MVVAPGEPVLLLQLLSLLCGGLLKDQRSHSAGCVHFFAELDEEQQGQQLMMLWVMPVGGFPVAVWMQLVLLLETAVSGWPGCLWMSLLQNYFEWHSQVDVES